MNTQFFKKSAIAAIAAVTLATGFTVVTVEEAEAGRRDFWAGVGAGVVTGVIVNEVARGHRERRYYREPAPRYSAWDAHVSWCYDRYKTYSHHDDRFTSLSGYRKPCYSPYK